MDRIRLSCASRSSKTAYSSEYCRNAVASLRSVKKYKSVFGSLWRRHGVNLVRVIPVSLGKWWLVALANGAGGKWWLVCVTCNVRLVRVLPHNLYVSFIYTARNSNQYSSAGKPLTTSRSFRYFRPRHHETSDTIPTSCGVPKRTQDHLAPGQV